MRLGNLRMSLLVHPDVENKLPYFVELSELVDQALEKACLAPCVTAGVAKSKDPDYGER